AEELHIAGFLQRFQRSYGCRQLHPVIRGQLITARQFPTVLPKNQYHSVSTRTGIRRATTVCIDRYFFHLPVYCTCQIRLPASSVTSREPSFATNGLTGRPQNFGGVAVTPSGFFPPSSIVKPVRKSSMGAGFPFWNGTKITL